MICSKCGQDKELSCFRISKSKGYTWRRKACIECLNAQDRERCNKGVRAKNKLLTKQMLEEKNRGLTFGQIAQKHKLNNSNVRKRVNKLAGLAELVD